MFDTSVDFIPTAVAGVNRACDIATQAGYACDRLFGSQASVQDVRNYLLSHRVKAVGNIGHGNPTGIALDDGDLTAAWFDTLPETALNNKVIYFNSCQVHNPPLETAVMGAGARTFIGGLVNLPIGPSEDVFKCFWQDSLINQSVMGIALAACETTEGLIGFHGLSGDPGQFSGSLVGDKDNFVAGDTVDTPPRSQRVLDLLNFIAADPGQGPGVDLDQGGANRPVGLTHYFAIPPQALITSAKVKFRVKSNDPLVYNDGVYYNDTVQASPLLPVIALRDLLGREPQAGEVLDLEINLGKVPVRTVDTTGGPGGHWSAQPNAFRDLLNILTRDNQLDLVFSDDLTVDYSELTVTFVLPTAPPGDLTGDTMVNQNDLNIILAALNTPAYSPNDPRDLDHDGRITVLDARKLVLLCSKPRCAIQ